MDKTTISEETKAQLRKQAVDGEPVDKLKALFEMQRELDAYIFEQHKDNLPTTLQEWVLKYTIALESEIDEVRKEVGWKWWKKQQDIDTAKLHEEVADLWFFLIALTDMVGMNSDDIYNQYIEKRKENFARQQGKSKDGKAYDYREEN